MIEVDESHVDDIIEEGDTVECVDNRKIWCDDANYSSALVVGEEYTVLIKKKYAGGGKNGPMTLKVDGKGAGGSWHLKSNFKLKKSKK